MKQSGKKKEQSEDDRKEIETKKPLEFYKPNKFSLPPWLVDSEAGATKREDAAIDVTRNIDQDQSGYGDSGLGETNRPKPHKKR
jgi:hypothetical protein